MFYGMPGGCQAPTSSQENFTSEAQNSAHSDAALSEKYLQKSLESIQPPHEEGTQCPALNAIPYCLSLRGRHLSPHKKASKFQALRSSSHHSGCLDLHDTGRGGLSALLFDSRKSPLKLLSQKKGTDGGVAWMTLDGSLVNVDDASSCQMGGMLGHQETVAWNGFAPLQKVLVVAITAAAASAAKQRHTKDIRCLQLAIATRDKDCEILREKIVQLQKHLSFWKERAQKFCEDLDATRKEITESYLLNLDQLESTPKCDSMMLEQFVTPQIQRQASVRMPDHFACFRRDLKSGNFKNSRDLGPPLPKEGPEDNNDKRTFLDRLSESPSFTEGQLTPQIPLTQLNKISTPADNVSLKQVGRLSRYCRKGCGRIIVAEDSSMSCVPATELIVERKERFSKREITITEKSSNFDRKDERLESDQSLTTSDLCCSTSNEGDQTNDSAFQAAVRSTVDSLVAPSSGRHHVVNHIWSSDVVIEQLLEELENAAAKVASMEAEIKSLRDSEVLCERKEKVERQLAESGFHTCKELETTLELLKNTEKSLALCKEACKKKDKAISKLEDEVAALQEMVSKLRSLQGTSNFVGQQDPSPVQTFLTSNLLFNLDSPVKYGSPLSAKSSFSSWRGLDELSRVSDSLERESRQGSCDSEMHRLERVRAWQTDSNKEEPECISSVLEVGRATHHTNNHAMTREPECISPVLEVERATHTNKQARTRETAEKSRNCRSDEEFRRSSSSTDEPLRKSNSSSTDESGSNTVRHGQLPQLPKSNSSHARKPRLSNIANTRFPDENGRRLPSPVEAGGGRRHDRGLSTKASNVLAGVEPNTPMRERKLNGNAKDKFLSHHSLDSLDKAKENFVHRRRWM